MKKHEQTNISSIRIKKEKKEIKLHREKKEESLHKKKNKKVKTYFSFLVSTGPLQKQKTANRKEMPMPKRKILTTVQMVNERITENNGRRASRFDLKKNGAEQGFLPL